MSFDDKKIFDIRMAQAIRKSKELQKNDLRDTNPEKYKAMRIKDIKETIESRRDWDLEVLKLQVNETDTPNDNMEVSINDNNSFKFLTIDYSLPIYVTHNKKVARPILLIKGSQGELIEITKSPKKIKPPKVGSVTLSLVPHFDDAETVQFINRAKSMFKLTTV